MVLSSVLMLAAVAALAVLMQWRRAALAGGGAALLLLLAAGCGPLPAALLADLQPADPGPAAPLWSGRNAIVLLGGGTQRESGGQVAPLPLAYSRILKAAELYRGCRASGGICTILVSGGDALGTGRSEAEVYADVLRRLGVAAPDLALEAQSMNTFRNAELSQAWLRRWRAQQVVLVTSGLHMRRAVLYFGHFGPRPSPARSDQLRIRLSGLPTSANLFATDRALHEEFGILRYAVYQAMGWNAAHLGVGQA